MTGVASGDSVGAGRAVDGVPSDTEILVRSGWKNFRTLRAGDRTLGYNPATGRSEWTPVLDKFMAPRRRVVRMSVGNWSARVTPDHRWLSERRTTAPVQVHGALVCPECGAVEGKRGRFKSSRAVQTHLGRVHGLVRQVAPYVRVGEFVRTDAITKAHRLRVAAQVDDGAGNDGLNDREVALLGWIVGDGHINHASRTVNVWIYQAKPHFVAAIDVLLEGIPHTRYKRDRNPGKHLPSVEWRLRSPYARDLLCRAGLDGDRNADDFVLGLSTRQREIWLDAVWCAEGWAVRSGQSGGSVKRLSQNVGPWADAMTLAVYLCGNRPTRHLTSREPHPSHSDNWIITLGRPWIGGTEIRFEEIGDKPVWGVSTALGTWTMRQDGLPMLSGDLAP